MVRWRCLSGLNSREKPRILSRPIARFPPTSPNPKNGWCHPQSHFCFFFCPLNLIGPTLQSIIILPVWIGQHRASQHNHTYISDCWSEEARC
ncbi:hypothetical protein SRHO_G00300020 [Serrasalmus rhombeus]